MSQHNINRTSGLYHLHDLVTGRPINVDDAGIKQTMVIERDGMTVDSLTHNVEGVDIVPDGCEYFVSHSDGDGDVASILFQNGPVSDNGINGLTNEVLLEILLHRTAVLDGRFPCHENKMALKHMREALVFLDMRTKRRQKEGTDGQMVEAPVDDTPKPKTKKPPLIACGLAAIGAVSLMLGIAGRKGT
ncbi:MAG: putative exported protein [Pseudomonadota bacterium]|jgi:hypothetical protein